MRSKNCSMKGRCMLGSSKRGRRRLGSRLLRNKLGKRTRKSSIVRFGNLLGSSSLYNKLC